MHNQKVNGFPVIVHKGREITEAAYAALSDDEKHTAKRKVNGPHHSAKWAHDGRNPPSTLSATVRGNRIHAGLEKHYNSLR
jgi:hypothetical protein